MIIGLSLGMLLLSVYLILIGIAPFVPAAGKLGKATSVIALLAGICLLIGR